MKKPELRIRFNEQNGNYEIASIFWHDDASDELETFGLHAPCGDTLPPSENPPEPTQSTPEPPQETWR